MSFEQRKELLEEAFELLTDAIGNITMAVKDTDQEKQAHGYLIPHLEDWLGDEGSNPYDMGIMDYIKALDEEFNGTED